jgi:hypothetical protein
MNRYILIDNHSGNIWGDVFATSPTDAAEKVDREAGLPPSERKYFEHGPRNASGASSPGYFVYAAPDDFPAINDGQDQTLINLVRVLPLVACVEYRDAESDSE